MYICIASCYITYCTLVIYNIVTYKSCAQSSDAVLVGPTEHAQLLIDLSVDSVYLASYQYQTCHRNSFFLVCCNTKPLKATTQKDTRCLRQSNLAEYSVQITWRGRAIFYSIFWIFVYNYVQRLVMDLMCQIVRLYSKVHVTSSWIQRICTM